jgi:hypothetical protein
LIETDVLMRQLLSLSFATHTTCLDIPNSDWYFLLFELDSCLLEDTFQKGSFPPSDSFPNGVFTNELLQFSLFFTLHEIVCEGKHHNHFGVISIVLLIALDKIEHTTSRNTFRHFKMLYLFSRLS